ncbi:cysteine-rich protein (plasmid) [Halobacterium salinarum R1]|uniref:Cysteine-rich protein n=1 Tax=Halobacterium salinarum (strain ATCC 29341 / DSM 671 / R1) TaxID=478009 RepID=B0R9B7_HALS3|nr:cysteine-rich protein [Halobacterium salinarum R1]
MTEPCPNCSGSGVIKTDSETNNCTVCSGDGNVTQPCPDCHGGTNECNACHGKGTISCSNCTGGTYRCSECGGSGTEACSECSGGTNPCGECGSRGTQPCLNCDEGQVTCSTCEGNTVVPCSTCDEDGTVPCSHCEGDNQLVYAEAGEVSYQTSTEKELHSDLGVDREMFNKGSVESTKTETKISPETADRGGEWIERQEVKSKQLTTLRVRYAVSPDGEREEYVAYRIDGAVHAPDRPENPEDGTQSTESVPDSDCPYCEIQLNHRDPEAYLRHWTDGSCTRTLQSLPSDRPSQVPTDVWWDIKYEWPNSGVWQPPAESDAHKGSNIIGSIVSSVRNLLK